VPGAKDRRVGAVRTFAFVAAASVVFAQLLPESLAEIGLPALLVFAVALAIPTTLERLAHRRHGADHDRGEHADDHTAGLELGYLGLLLHSFGDGIAVGALSDPATGRYPLGLTLSIAAHTVPVTALFVVTFAGHRGRRSALIRAACLGGAVVAGVVTAGATPAWAERPFEPWVTAAVAGFLLHVIAHDWPVEPVRTRGQRALEILAIAAGLVIALLPGHPAEDPGHGAAQIELGAAFFELALETAPMLLLGLVAAAAVQAFGSRLPERWLAASTTAGQALRGALLGAPLPVCACGVLPIAAALARRGLAPALVVSFLLATPELGLETFALSVRFLGWRFALVRLVAAPLAAIVAAVLVAAVAHDRAHSVGSRDTAAALGELTRHGDRRPFATRALAHFDELLFHTGAWTLVGLVAASYVAIALPAEAFADLARRGLDILVVSAAAVPSYVCASSATPLAAVLVAKGLSPGAALAALLLGPATNVATLVFLTRTFGGRAALAAVAGLLGATWAFAFGVNAAGLRLPVDTAIGAPHEHGLGSWASLVLLGLLVARGVWKSGLRAWLASLEVAFSAGATAHGPGPGPAAARAAAYEVSDLHSQR
jgi:uncharacterized protein